MSGINAQKAECNNKIVHNRRLRAWLALPIAMTFTALQGVIFWSARTMNPSPESATKNHVFEFLPHLIILGILLALFLYQSRKRFDTIQNLNHEVRNGLQIIALADVIGPTHDAAMNEAITNITQAITKATKEEAM